MTKIDFYILEQPTAKHCELFACRVIDKALRMGHSIYIHTSDESSAGRMDDVLWTFKQGSFIAHDLHTPDKHHPAPVLISSAGEPHDHHDVLINMSSTVPEFFSRFERVAEIVAGDEQNKQHARNRFRFYKERGYLLDTHNV